MALVERDASLAVLAAGLADAARGLGRTVVVAGEAGIGKTTLVEHFVAEARTDHVLWGGCEALSTPEPLGPVHELARDAGPALRAALAAGHDRTALFAAMLDELARAPSPALVVLEDVHWADAATLDLVRYVGRRIHRRPALMVLTTRDDDTSLANLRPVLADLPAAHVTRIAVPPLSRAAVEGLARAGAHDAAAVHAVSGGNPFFVTELLKDEADAVPTTVRDAVLGRALRLDPAARDVLELVATAPRTMEVSLVDKVLGSSTDAIADCIACGLLVADAQALRFRHDLARTAIETSLPSPRAMALHAQVFAALSARPAGAVPLAQLVHHARLANDVDAIMRLAPAAAREAALRGARREAASHCAIALTHAHGLDDDAHAELLDDYATHCFELNDLAAAIPAREAAIALFARTGNVARESETLAAHAMPLVRALRNADADEASRRALALAETLPPGRARARAYATESYLRMLARDHGEAMGWGRKAIALARDIGDDAIVARALTSTGAAQVFVDFEAGTATLLEALALAERLPDGGAAVADAYVMLGTASGELFRFAQADRSLEEGIAFARVHDLDRVARYMEGWQALADFYQGRWEMAGVRADALVERETGPSVNRVIALVALGRLRARRGDPGADEALAEALELARRSGTLQRVAPVCGARDEAAWTARRPSPVDDTLREAYALARSKRHPWFVGELAYWLWIAGEITAPPDDCAEPYALQIAGRWREAAAAWKALGCPYEEARALADGDEDAQRAALAILDQLGAVPLAERIRERMREAGVARVPRGPQRATRGNVAGLTARELQILQLVADGLRNAQIATRLSRSTRTVDHHVESILSKLDAPSRADAVAAARRMGLLK